MPRKGGILNRKPRKTRASNKLNPWLLKHVVDRASPFTARSAIPVSIPSLLSHIWQHHLGESNGRLARWVLTHASLAFTMPRVIRLPLVSGASDFVRRKSTFVPPVWQRMLNLTWLRQPQRQENGSGPTVYAVADWPRTNDTGPGSNGPEPARLLQTAPANKAGQLAHETDEAYPQAKKESIPLMTTPLFSPPVIGREMCDTTVAAMPARTKPVADRLYLHGLTKIAPVTEEEHPVSIVNRSSSAIIKNLLSLPLLGKRLPDTTGEHSDHARPGSRPLMTKQIAVGQPTEDADDSTLPYISQSQIPNPGIDRSSEVLKPDRRHVEVAQERLAQVDSQSQRTYLPRLLSRLLTPITQRVTLQHRLVEARPHLISEGRASQIGYAHYPKAVLAGAESGSATAGQVPEPFIASTAKFSPSDEAPSPAEHTLASSTQPAALERKALPDALPGPSKPAVTKAVAKGLSLPTVPRTASKPDGLASNSPLHQGVFPLRAAVPPPLEVGQTRVKEPVISRAAEPAGQKAEVILVPEALSNPTVSPDTLSVVTGVHSSMVQGFPERHAEKSLPYRQPLSITGLAMRLPVVENISRTMAFPTQQLFKSVAGLPLSNKSEDHGFLQSREYVSSLPSYQYARQPALELPVAAPARPKADFGAARSEELFRHMSDTKPEPTYSRNHQGPELSLAAAPVGQVLRAEEPPRPTAPASRGEKRGEKETAPDLRALAREIYPLIKRMVMVERERRPT